MTSGVDRKRSGLVPHGLRHTAASLAIAAGADVKVVQQMLGHKSATMTLDLYGHLFDDRLSEVADALDRAVANLPVANPLPGSSVDDLAERRRTRAAQRTRDGGVVHLIEHLSLFAKQGELLINVSSRFNRNRTRTRHVPLRPHRKLSPDELAELVQLYESGLDLTPYYESAALADPAPSGETP